MKLTRQLEILEKRFLIHLRGVRLDGAKMGRKNDAGFRQMDLLLFLALE